MARICIDGFNLAMPSGSGIATYARNLNSVIASIGHETQILFGPERKLSKSNLLNQIALFDSKVFAGFGIMQGLRRRVPLFRPEATQVTMTGDVISAELASQFPAAGRYWASRDVFHSANVAHGAYGRFTPLRLGPVVETDIMHWTCPLPLFEPRIANVYTLHDMIPLRLPFTTLDNKRAYYGMCKSIVRRADRIFTVSENSRNDIVRLLDADENRVINTYQAVDVPAHLRERSREDIASELEGAFGLHAQEYFLYFGALEPKKNLGRIIEAYLSSGVKVPLVIVGRAWKSKKWLDDETLTRLIPEALIPPALVRRQAHLLESQSYFDRLALLNDRIVRYEHLPFAALVTLIQGARAVLFPSLYEGFGLPVLEAMQLGTPVLTSTAGSLPEVAADAALLVDPYDGSAIRDGIRALDADEGLREHLAEKGRSRAQVFSPARYRERLREAYASLH